MTCDSVSEAPKRRQAEKNETASCCDEAQANNAGRPSCFFPVFFFFVLLILTSILLLCQTRENDARRRKALLLFVWDDVWPLSLATSPAPRITHPLGPNVDKDRKTTTAKQNVNVATGTFSVRLCDISTLTRVKNLNPDTWGQSRSSLM